jgi:WD40 repeat protein
MQSVRLWNATDMQCRHVLRDHQDKVTAAVWSSSGALLATASLDQKALLYRVPPDGNHCTLVATMQVRGLLCITVLAKDLMIQRPIPRGFHRSRLRFPRFSITTSSNRAPTRPTFREHGEAYSHVYGCLLSLSLKQTL